MKKEVTLNINLAELTDDELLGFRNQLLTQREILTSDYVEEIKNQTQGDFDPYSRRGQKIINKVVKKFSDRNMGLTYLEDVVADEIRKREKYKEEQRYVKGGKVDFGMTEKEFLEREHIITESYKSRIDEN